MYEIIKDEFQYIRQELLRKEYEESIKDLEEACEEADRVIERLKR